MNDDLVRRLLWFSPYDGDGVLREAADEIERLSAIVDAVDAWCEIRLPGEGHLARELRALIRYDAAAEFLTDSHKDVTT